MLLPQTLHFEEQGFIGFSSPHALGWGKKADRNSQQLLWKTFEVKCRDPHPNLET